MSNSDANNSYLTNVNTNSPSPSPSCSSIRSPLTTSTTCSTSTSPLSTTPRRIVKAKLRLAWRYFNNSKDYLLNVECVLCSSIILRKSSSTSNLLHHIQAQHNTEYQTLNKAMKLQTPTSDLSNILP